MTPLVLPRAAGTLAPAAAAAAQIKAVAFDGFVIFDPRPVFALAGRS